MITLNVLGEEHRMFEPRVNAQIEKFEKSDSHIICLQEVTPKYVKILSKSRMMRSGRWWMSSHPSGDEMTVAGLIILSRIPILRVFETPLSTTMGRTGLTVLAATQIGSVSVSTVHLESLDNSELRQQQLEKMTEIAREHPRSLIMGDFNFDLDYPYKAMIQVRAIRRKVEDYTIANFHSKIPPKSHHEEATSIARICPDFIDCWPLLHPNDKGYTFDSENNSLPYQYTQMRLDYMLSRGFREPQIKSIELWGNSPVDHPLTRSRTLFLSDHFGLECVFCDDQNQS